MKWNDGISVPGQAWPHTPTHTHTHTLTSQPSTWDRPWLLLVSSCWPWCCFFICKRPHAFRDTVAGRTSTVGAHAVFFFMCPPIRVGPHDFVEHFGCLVLRTLVVKRVHHVCFSLRRVRFVCETWYGLVFLCCKFIASWQTPMLSMFLCAVTDWVWSYRKSAARHQFEPIRISGARRVPCECNDPEFRVLTSLYL